MNPYKSSMALVGIFLSLACGKVLGAAASNDVFNADVSLVASSNPPISDVYFFRAYTDLNGATVGQLTAAPDLNWGDDNSLIGLLLPAVQNPANESYSLVGFCDGSVVVGMADGSARGTIGNPNFDFSETFGVEEADMISDLQNGDENAIIVVCDTAFMDGLLPAVQRGVSSPGTLVSFSTPAEAGTISVTEAPEPGMVGLLGMAALLCRRKR